MMGKRLPRLEILAAHYSWLWHWCVALVRLGAGTWANCEVGYFFSTDERLEELCRLGVACFMG